MHFLVLSCTIGAICRLFVKYKVRIIAKHYFVIKKQLKDAEEYPEKLKRMKEKMKKELVKKKSEEE